MGSMPKSIVAGFGATIVLSLLMILKATMGMLSAMNAIALLSHMGHKLVGLPLSPATGWVLHFLIGSLLWGILYAWSYRMLPGRSAVPKALTFSVVAWLLMMVIVMPMAGQGLFAAHIGIMAAVATLVLHLVWGLALGLIYQVLTGPASSAEKAYQ